MEDFTELVRREARRLGFFRIGIAPVGPLPWSRRYDEWLRRGMQGKMAYLVRQARKRRDPALLLDGARSLLILAMNYQGGPEFERDGTDPMRGNVSRYARGEDYHKILGLRLESLEKWIRRQRPGARTRSYVDTGPVMEKVWGAHSSLGWMGKHTNLITREQGSWFFLGALVVDFELDYDVKSKDHCGTCSKCIDICPTHAIVAPYVLDARLCISYLTIELRGPIPRDLRPLIGNRIFGCDDCQEICPWNRFATKTEEDSLLPRNDSIDPELAELADLGEEDFRERFAESPIRRCRREGLARNVAVALGNCGSSEALPALARLLGDPHPLVRGHAAWGLGQIGGVEASGLLYHAVGREREDSVVTEIERALSRLATPR